MCLLNVLFPKKFKPSKFNTLARLAISRSSLLKKQQEVRFLQVKSDVIELLQQGQQDRAIVRVHLVIKYDNMIDVFSMIVEYCHLLIERVQLLETSEECPGELKEAISSLIYASSRIAEFPELKMMSRIFISLLGREFAARAIELRNSCGVNSQIIQKLSSGHPSLKSKYRALKVIADEKGLFVEDPFAVATQADYTKQESGISIESGRSYGSVGVSRSYSNVAEALEDAYEAASFAAEASKVAVELSLQESQDSEYGGGSGSSRGSSGRKGASYVTVVGR